MRERSLIPPIGPGARIVTDTAEVFPDGTKYVPGLDDDDEPDIHP